MQQHAAQTGENHHQQPALPSYAEAISSAPPPENIHYIPYINNGPPYAQTGTAASPYVATTNSFQTHFPGQSQNYNGGMIFPPNSAVGSYPTAYAANTYPQYGPTLDDSGVAPTTIHIIRPVPTQPATCCSGRSGRILAIVLSIVILAAILRVTMNSYF